MAVALGSVVAVALGSVVAVALGSVVAVALGSVVAVVLGSVVAVVLGQAAKSRLPTPVGGHSLSQCADLTRYFSRDWRQLSHPYRCAALVSDWSDHQLALLRVCIDYQPSSAGHHEPSLRAILLSADGIE